MTKAAGAEVTKISRAMQRPAVIFHLKNRGFFIMLLRGVIFGFVLLLRP